MAASIVADKLTKYYGREKTAALDALSFTIKAGEIYGFLGANGAGKSTTIRLLMNFLQPSSGRASINGLDVVRDCVKVKQYVGYLSGDVALYSKVTGDELLDYLGKLQRRSSAVYRYKLEKQFEADIHKPIGALSKGNRQKIGIIQALMHQPDVLILDEPTTGLDPLMQEVFYDALREAKARGAAVLMSSHNLAEAQALCDRIGIIKHGKLVREQGVNDPTGLGKPILRLVLRSANDVARLKRTSGLHVISTQNSSAVVQLTSEIAPALKSLSSFDIVSLASEQPDLENEFLQYYEDAK